MPIPTQTELLLKLPSQPLPLQQPTLPSHPLQVLLFCHVNCKLLIFTLPNSSHSAALPPPCAKPTASSRPATASPLPNCHSCKLLSGTWALQRALHEQPPNLLCYPSSHCFLKLSWTSVPSRNAQNTALESLSPAHSPCCPTTSECSLLAHRPHLYINHPSPEAGPSLSCASRTSSAGGAPSAKAPGVTAKTTAVAEAADSHPTAPQQKCEHSTLPCLFITLLGQHQLGPPAWATSQPPPHWGQATCHLGQRAGTGDNGSRAGGSQELRDDSRFPQQRSQGRDRISPISPGKNFPSDSHQEEVPVLSCSPTGSELLRPEAHLLPSCATSWVTLCSFPGICRNSGTAGIGQAWLTLDRGLQVTGAGEANKRHRTHLDQTNLIPTENLRQWLQPSCPRSLLALTQLRKPTWKDPSFSSSEASTW